MGTRRNFRRGWVVQNVKYPPCLASPGIAWAALVKGGSAYSTKAELNSLALGALQGWPSGLGCWDGWRHGWSAWAVASSGAGGGRRSYAVIFCALPSLLPSPPLSLSRSSAPWVQAVGLALVFGWALALHERRRSRFPGLGRAGASCWPCILSASAGCWLCLASSGGWLSPGSWWPLLGVDCLGAAGCWLWLRLGFPGSWLRLGAGLAGVQAVPVVVAGLGDGQAVGVVAGVSRSSNCTNQALQVWLLFKGKAINFERFFLDFAHKVRYNSTRVKEIVNQLRFAASPLVDGGRNPQKGLVKQS